MDFLLNRRRLLSGLAAASTAAATGTAAIASVPAENPELLHLGELLDGALHEAIRAFSAVQAIDAAWSPRWPSAPKELHSGWDGWGDRVERDLFGFGIKIENDFGGRRLHEIHTVESLEWHRERELSVLKGRSIDKRKIRGMDRKGWEKALAGTEELQQVARRYEARCASIRKRSGIEAATARRKEAVQALKALVGAIMDQMAVTMDGVMVKAQALDAWSIMPASEKFFVAADTRQDWGAALAADILRLSSFRSEAAG